MFVWAEYNILVQPIILREREFSVILVIFFHMFYTDKILCTLHTSGNYWIVLTHIFQESAKWEAYTFGKWVVKDTFVSKNYVSSVLFMLLQPPPAWLATSWCRSLWSPWKWSYCSSRWSLNLCLALCFDHQFQIIPTRGQVQQCTTERAGWQVWRPIRLESFDQRNRVADCPACCVA